MLVPPALRKALRGYVAILLVVAASNAQAQEEFAACPAPEAFDRWVTFEHRPQTPKVWDTFQRGWTVEVVGLGPESAVVAATFESSPADVHSDPPSPAFLRVSPAGEVDLGAPPGDFVFIAPRMAPAEDGFHLVWGEIDDRSEPAIGASQLWYSRWHEDNGWSEPFRVVSAPRRFGGLHWNLQWGSMVATENGEVAVAARGPSRRDVYLARSSGPPDAVWTQEVIELPFEGGGPMAELVGVNGQLAIALDELDSQGQDRAVVVPLSPELEAHWDRATWLDMGRMRPLRFRWVFGDGLSPWLLVGGGEAEGPGVRFDFDHLAAVEFDPLERSRQRTLTLRWEDLGLNIWHLPVAPSRAGGVPVVGFSPEEQVPGVWAPGCGIQWDPAAARRGSTARFNGNETALLGIFRDEPTGDATTAPSSGLRARFWLASDGR